MGLGMRISCRATVAKAEQAMFGIVRSTDPDFEGGHLSDDRDNCDDAALQFVNEWLSAIADYCIGLIVTQLGQVNCRTVLRCSDLCVLFSYYTLPRRFHNFLHLDCVSFLLT